jgi:hypothetical protein
VGPDPAELIVRGEDHLSAAVQIIDNLLQPAPEMLLAPELQQYPQKSVKSSIKQLFRNAFILSGGLPVVLCILIATPVDSNSIIDSTALSVALHIVHFLLTSSGAPPTSSSDADFTITDELLLQVEQYSVQVASKLLQVASRAGAFHDPGVVQDALVVISQLIASPEVVQQLTTGGSSQPIVFRWLLYQLAAMRHNDDNCSELFCSMR